MKKKLFCWQLYCRYLGPWLGTWTLFLKQLKVEKLWVKKIRPLFRPWQFINCFGWHGLSILKAVDKEQKNILINNDTLTLDFRPGTTDYEVFEHIFVDRVYGIRLDKNETRRVVDCGANVGFSSLFLIQHFPYSHVVAIEPDSGNLKQLTANCSSCQRIDILPGAVWSHSGKVWIENQDAASWSFRVGEKKQKGKEAVDAYGVVDIMKRFQWETIDLLKLDVEGAEVEIFCKNADEWLKKVGCIVCELHEEKVTGCIGAFEAAMSRNGFDVIYYDENVIGINSEYLRR